MGKLILENKLNHHIWNSQPLNQSLNQFPENKLFEWRGGHVPFQKDAVTKPEIWTTNLPSSFPKGVCGYLPELREEKLADFSEIIWTDTNSSRTNSVPVRTRAYGDCVINGVLASLWRMTGGGGSERSVWKYFRIPGELWMVLGPWWEYWQWVVLRFLLDLDSSLLFLCSLNRGFDCYSFESNSRSGYGKKG